MGRTHPTEPQAFQPFDVTALPFLLLASAFLGLTVEHPDFTVYKAGVAQDESPLLSSLVVGDLGPVFW